MAFTHPHTNVGVSAEVHRLLVIARGATGAPIADIADRAILVGLREMMVDDPHLERIPGFRDAVRARSEQRPSRQAGPVASGEDDFFAPPRKRRRSRRTVPSEATHEARRFPDPFDEALRFAVNEMAEKDPAEMVRWVKERVEVAEAERMGVDAWATATGMGAGPEFRDAVQETLLQRQTLEAQALRDRARAALVEARAAARSPARSQGMSAESVVGLAAAAFVAGVLTPKSVVDQMVQGFTTMAAGHPELLNPGNPSTPPA